MMDISSNNISCVGNYDIIYLYVHSKISPQNFIMLNVCFDCATIKTDDPAKV